MLCGIHLKKYYRLIQKLDVLLFSDVLVRLICISRGYLCLPVRNVIAISIQESIDQFDFNLREVQDSVLIRHSYDVNSALISRDHDEDSALIRPRHDNSNSSL